jgi:Immunity protein 27
MNVAAGTHATFIPDVQGSVIASLDSGSGTLSKIGRLPYGKKRYLTLLLLAEDERQAVRESLSFKLTDTSERFDSTGTIVNIDPDETVLTGRWLPNGQGGYVDDDTCRRIDRLVHTQLNELGRDASGWDVLYRDSNDGRLWELIFPHSELHGGGPPQIRCLTVDQARQKYGEIPE